MDCSLPTLTATATATAKSLKPPINEEFFRISGVRKDIKNQRHINNRSLSHIQGLSGTMPLKLDAVVPLGRNQMLVETAFYMSLAIGSFLHIKPLATLVISIGQLFSYNLHVH